MTRGDMTAFNSPAWRDLEARIGAYFAANGYETQLNVVREGRSGGRHEMDVFATKSDGITSFELMIECKLWQSPIEKDVVSKADYVVRDLGLNKAIIVSTSGWRVGAEHAAKELGIELWDAKDLEQKLGQLALAELNGAGSGAQRQVVGPMIVLDDTGGERLVQRERTGVFGREELAWRQLAWAPFYLFELRLSETERRMLRGAQLKSHSITNLYNGLTGAFHTRLDSAKTPLGEVAVDLVIQPRVRERDISSDLVKAWKRLETLTSEEARRRQAAKLKALGLPLPFTSLNVDRAIQVAWPYYVGLLRRGDKERLVAIDAVRSALSTKMTTTLTEHHAYVLDALRRRGSTSVP